MLPSLSRVFPAPTRPHPPLDTASPLRRWRLLFVVAWLLAAGAALAQSAPLEIVAGDLELASEGRAYASYLAAPAADGPWPGLVLIHSFNGLEAGYRTMTDRVAAEGFVVLAVGWQTFEQSPSDTVLAQLVRDAATFLQGRQDVDPERLGLTGFCAGGRATMLLLPQIDAFGAGVAWYGFPYNGDPAPAAFVADLEAPLLIVHGTADRPSPIADIYRYATELDGAGRSFELKVYQGEPHGFMLVGGELREDEVASAALNEMVAFFRRKLGGS